MSAERLVVADYASNAVADALSEVHALMIQALEEDLRKREFVGKLDVVPFLKELIGFRCDEALAVLFLDSGCGLIDYEIMAVGGSDSVELDCRRILLRAIGRAASGLIVAHNHPSGDSRPSTIDIAVTRRLADAARFFGIALRDHLVVAGGEVSSALFVD